MELVKVELKTALLTIITMGVTVSTNSFVLSKNETDTFIFFLLDTIWILKNSFKHLKILKSDPFLFIGPIFWGDNTVAEGRQKFRCQELFVIAFH